MLERYKRRFEEEKINYKWHLPSEEVLYSMYKNLHKKREGNFSSNSAYWSSSAPSPTTLESSSALSIFFGSGFPAHDSKLIKLAVRAVRGLPKRHNETERVFSFKGQDYQAYEKDAQKHMNWVDAIKWCERLN